MVLFFKDASDSGAGWDGGDDEGEGTDATAVGASVGDNADSDANGDGTAAAGDGSKIRLFPLLFLVVAMMMIW